MTWQKGKSPKKRKAGGSGQLAEALESLESPYDSPFQWYTEAATAAAASELTLIESRDQTIEPYRLG